MNRDELGELWAVFVSGQEMSPEERERLSAGLQSDPAFLEEVLEDAEIHGLLRSMEHVRTDAEPFARSIHGYFENEQDAARFVKKVESGIPVGAPAELSTPDSESRAPEVRISRPRTRGWRAGRSEGAPRSVWGLGLAAAGVIFIVFLIALTTFSGPDSSDSASADAARARIRRESEELRRRQAAEEERRRIEEETARTARLREIERKRQELAKPQPVDSPAIEERRKAELAALQAEKESIERKMSEAIAEARLKQTPPPKAPEPPPSPQVPPREPAEAVTVAEVARAERVEGESYLTRASGREALRAGGGIRSGDRVDTVGEKSLAVLSFMDSTRIELGPNTELRDVWAAGTRRLRVAKGVVKAEVARQAPGNPMVFVTPHGEATVLGTTLRVLVDPSDKGGTRLEVIDGKVRLKRASDGKTVEVQSGHYAVAAAGAELVAKPLELSVREIVLYAADLARGDLHGVWSKVNDAGAAAGVKAVLPRPQQDSMTPALAAPAHFVEFSFDAPAGVAFRLWVRMKAETGFQNSFWVQFSDSVDETGRPIHRIGTADSFDINARFSPDVKGWFWERDHNAVNAKDRRTNAPVRFGTTGKHRLRLQFREGGIALDQVVLSAERFIEMPPGATTEDATILPRAR